jgi:hypothetical protein
LAVTNLTCFNTKTGGLKLTWEEQPGEIKNRATSFLVVEGYRGINEVVNRKEYSLEGNWSKDPVYEFMVIGKN